MSAVKTYEFRLGDGESERVYSGHVISPFFAYKFISKFSDFELQGKRNEGVMEIVMEIIPSKPVRVRASDGETGVIGNAADFDRWFAKYPQDIAEFGANVFSENVTPFLSQKTEI